MPRCSKSECVNGRLLNVVVLHAAFRQLCPPGKEAPVPCENRGQRRLAAAHTCTGCWIRYLDKLQTEWESRCIRATPPATPDGEDGG